MNTQPSICIYRSCFEGAKHLPVHEQHQFWGYVMNFVFEDKIPEGQGIAIGAFLLVKPELTRQKNRFEENEVRKERNRQEVASAT